ncbi:MAG: twin-arginine translocase subunit TatC, partial [Gammaproteobacteria bacterium]
HLLELRDRLLRVILVVTLIFLGLFPFANILYSFMAEPLLAHMPTGSSMIAVEVISPFLTPLKLSLYAALFIAMPYILYQAWAFVAPGLYLHEKRLATPLLISSVILFYCGVAFAYYVVFPLVFNFLVGVAPEGVAVMTDISKYLDFVLALFFAFGLAFEVPVATIILIATGISNAESLSQKRPYIIVGAFVIGMLLTPPDIISQIMLALPMWLLFELGIVMSKVLIQPSEDEEDEEAEPTPATTPQSSRPAQAAAATSEPGYAEPLDINDYPSDYQPLTEEELEAELDAIDDWGEDDEEEDDEEGEPTEANQDQSDIQTT